MAEELQKAKKGSRKIKKWVAIIALVEMLAILLMCPYAVYILNPGISDAAAGFAWAIYYLLGVTLNMGVIIVSISLLLLYCLKRFSKRSWALYVSLVATIIFATIGMIPGAMLSFWWVAFLIDGVIQFSCFLSSE